LNIGADELKHAVLYLIAFILSITVHEFGHAWVATRLGDPTPRSQGRVTLSPQHHIDPIGTILMPIIMALSASSGVLPLLAWGRPVQTNPMAYTRRLSMSAGRMLVSLAGPLMNLAMAFAVSIIIVVGARLHASGELLMTAFNYLVRLNLSLMIFNLLPIPPLDGGAVLSWILPRSMHNFVDFLGRYGSFVLLFLVISPSLGLPLMRIIGYPIDVLTYHWARGLSMAIGS
jgi:Zn-dependent protease